MTESNDPNLTADLSANDSLDAGLAAAFARPASHSGGSESVLAVLRHTYGELRPVLLKDADCESAHVVRPHSDAMPPLNETGARYQISGEIARGGMGAVLRGRDVDLGRDLAVKVLLERYANKPDVARRFLEEAQVGAQLQHPGIVPVYDIGRFGDRPFFTMKLVKGRTLSALLAERDGPGDDLARFLGNFLQVAQTLAYAHAKGVIHRDLKPANVMVGSFGEVQVMDWGLAKVLTEGGVADEARTIGRDRERAENPTIIRTSRTGSGGSFGTETEAGSLLGTPAYMPPEQANGDVDRLDRRADVFGLGAILCEILTGQPPYVGRSADEVRRKAANGDQTEMLARLDACGADGDLLALARSCLAPEPVDRPRDAQAVADAVSDHLNGVQERLRTSEIERAEAVVKAGEERKRRRVQLALTACVLGMWLLGGAGVWWWRERRSEANRGVETALAEARSLQQQGHWPDALAAARRAEAISSGADGRLSAQVRATLADLRMLTALEQAPLAIADRRNDANDFTGADERYAAAFREYGVDAFAVAPAEAVERLRGSAIRETIAVSLDAWGNVRAIIGDGNGQARLLQIARGLDDDPWRQRFRKIRVTGNGPSQADLRALAQDAGIANQPAICLVILSRHLRQVGSMVFAAELIQKAQRRHPEDLSLAVEAGTCHLDQNPPKIADAIRYFSVAEALRPKSALVQNALGRAMHRDGQLAEAEALFRQAAENDPEYWWTYINLGRVLDDQHRRAEAVAAFQHAFDLRPDSPHHWFDFGMAMRDQKLLPEAESLARQATLRWPDDADSWQSLGAALGDQAARGILDKLPESIASLRKSLALNPKLGLAHFDLGKALALQGKPAEAEPELRQAAALLPSFSWVTRRLVEFYLSEKRPVDAAKYQRIIVEQHPDESGAWQGLAECLRDAGDGDAATDAARRATALDPKNAAAHYLLGQALLRNHAVAVAAVELQKATELNPREAAGFIALGDALTELNEPGRALAAYRTAFDLSPRALNPNNRWIGAMHRLGRLNEVLPIWKKLLEAHDDEPEEWLGYGELNLVLNREAEYRWACTEMLRRFGSATNPTTLERCARACLLRPVEGRELEQALAMIDRAAAADPSHPYYLFFQLAKGLAHLRRGEFDLAIERARMVESHGIFPPICRTIVALAQHSGGQAESARKTLEIDGDYVNSQADINEWVYCILRREANRRILPHFVEFLEGRYTPTRNDERRQFVIPCYFEGRHRLSAGLFAAIFAADAVLLDDVLLAYNAGCFAALAGVGAGRDASADDADRARLRRQALDWLNHARVALAGQIDSNPAFVLRTLHDWPIDPDLAGVRGDAIARLPESEQADWRKFWADAADLLRKAGSP